LGWSVADMCFNGDHRLHLTEFTQPCILTTEIAVLRGLFARYGFAPSIYGGHSLGEFTALVGAGVLPLSAAVKIVQSRGRVMQGACPVGFGGMAAVIIEGLDIDKLNEVIRDLPLDIANINSSRQVVISGASDRLPEAESRIKKAFSGKKKLFVVPLKVSAPFHSRFMSAAEKAFEEILLENSRHFIPQKAKTVTSNYTGNFHTGSSEDLFRSLTFQLGHAVRWKDNMEALARAAGEIYEVGPARNLGGDFKTVNVNCRSVVSLAAADEIFSNKVFQLKEV
ncbi:MAG: ACP S-malonyltransferase, partial [Syntrophales bacterium]